MRRHQHVLKVLSVMRSTGSTKPNLEFSYDASGQRVCKKVIKPNGTITSTYYVRDASGNVMSVYESVNTQLITVKEQYIYGSSRIGVYNAGDNNSSNSHTLGLRHYELTDHLGNVRVVLSDYKQDVISASDYYPFGMVVEGRRVLRNEKYRYGFNGKEKDDENFEGAYDFGARILDVRLGRWLSVDPQRNKQQNWSTYKFGMDNPILFIDPDGNTEILTIKYTDEKTGKTLTLKMADKRYLATDGKQYKVHEIGDNYHYVNQYYDYETNYLITKKKDGSLIVTRTTKVLSNRPAKSSEVVWFGGDSYGDVKRDWSVGALRGNSPAEWTLDNNGQRQGGGIIYDGNGDFGSNQEMNLDAVGDAITLVDGDILSLVGGMSGSSPEHIGEAAKSFADGVDKAIDSVQEAIKQNEEGNNVGVEEPTKVNDSIPCAACNGKKVHIDDKKNHDTNGNGTLSDE